ncbi:hypothetical protein LIER_22025 [Lithospermum erythrorhizon]|uniref:Reverse transcriptase zinc-binding domain-containing protein n=1 Tax=Lithospermum erythrorhizon TaxID=34254 RepID=A0AAV3QSI9_LITER
MEVDPLCVLCGGLESHDHLFFVCPYSAEVWRVLLQRLGEYRGAMPWAQERLWVDATMGGRSFPKRIKQVAFVSIVAVLWEEHNLRLLTMPPHKSKRSLRLVAEGINEVVVPRRARSGHGDVDVEQANVHPIENANPEPPIANPIQRGIPVGAHVQLNQP